MQGKGIDRADPDQTAFTFLFLISNKIWGFRAGIHKMLVRIANREHHDQTAV